MKTFDVWNQTGHHDPQAPPEFELEYLVDDIQNPSEVMVVPFGCGDTPESRWLTADIRDAVPLEWVR